MFRKEIYLPFILSISLFLIIGYSSYNHIVLGEEEDSNDGNDNDNNVREEEKEEEEDSNDGNYNDNNVREEEKEEEEKDFEDASLDELFDDEDGNDGNDNDNNAREEEKEEKEENGKKEEDEVPFILPFTAVPFP